MLRGFALLGILVMNIQALAMPAAAYGNPTAYGDLNGVNWWIWVASHVFADQKFMAIFSMLFGAGVCLFADRATAKHGKSAGLHYRRTGWLLLFGLAHAHLIWFGDVLVPYAISALFVYWFRNRRPTTQLIWGVLLLLLPFGFNFALAEAVQAMPAEEVAELRLDWKPDAATLDEELATYRGGWLEQLPDRVEKALFFETVLLLTYFLWRSAGMMLVGMALYRWGVLSAKRSLLFYRGLLLVAGGFGLGLIGTGVAKNIEANFSFEYTMFLGAQWNYWGSVGLALAYTAAVMLALREELFAGLMRRLSAAGQMAFTNYISQSVLCTLLFYGHGLGRFGHFERWQQALVVVSVWALQLLWSPWWLQRFRFGPLEWLWRSLTYWKLQPLKR